MTYSIKIGDLHLPTPIIYAPLAGCSDFPIRQMIRKFHKGLMFCEMVKMEALVRYDSRTFRLLDYGPGMHPIGAQLCGSDPKLAAQAARIIADLGFDVVDLNCGCPVDKVTKDHSGSGLLKYPDRIGEILSNMVSAVKIPVSVKIRIGWDEKHLVAKKITTIAEQAGARAIYIHGRTREQKYKGNADWQRIQECVNTAKTIKVIGNGDVFSVEDVKKMLLLGCDGVLIARGYLGAPWIGQSALSYLSGMPVEPYSFQQIKDWMLEHFYLISCYQPQKKALLDMRRVGCWYLKTFDGIKEFRQALNKIQTVQEGMDLIQNFQLPEETINFSSFY